MTYFIPGWPFGFSGDAGAQSPNAYGNFPSFDSDIGSGGSSYARYNFPNGWFVGSESRGVGLGMNISQMGAFGNRSLSYDGVQFGYNFKNSGLPVAVYAGFDTLKYNSGIGGNLFAPFDSQSGTLPGYSAHAGVEIRPTQNLSLSLGFGYTQQSGRIDSDINTPLLPGASPLAISGHR